MHAIGNSRSLSVADVGALGLGTRRFRRLISPRHGAARHDADKVGTVFGATMDVGVHAVRRQRKTFERLRREALFQRLLERRDPEHAVGTRAGYGDADLRTAL